MKKYSFFKKILHSFYSADVYKYVAFEETNTTGFKYLLLLISIFWAPEIIKLHLDISHYIKNDLPQFIEKFPVIKITNGTASFDKPSPYIITDEETENDIIIFDTSGYYISLENTEAKVLITDSKVLVKKSDIETREFNFSTINNFILTHEKIYSWSEWGNYLSIFFYIFIIPLAFIYRALQALIYSVIGLLFQSILKTDYSFQTIYRLSILAITPAFIFDKALGYFDFDFTGWSYICLFMSLSYLFIALKANRRED